MEKLKEQTTEIAVIELQPELLAVAESSGVVITEAQAIGLRFAPFMRIVNEISLKIAELDPENITPETAAMARRYRLDLVENRGTKGVETLHKELKLESLTKGRLIDSYKNTVVLSSEMTEAVAEKIEKHQERIEAQKRAELKQSRIALLLPFETDTEYLPLDIMDEERFQALLTREKEAFEAVQAKRKQDELDRIEAERLAEEKRLAEIEAEKQKQIERDAEIAELKKKQEAAVKAEINRIEKLVSNGEKNAKVLIKAGFDEIKGTDRQADRFVRSGQDISFGWLQDYSQEDVYAIIEKANIHDLKEKEAVDRQAELDKANAEADRIRKELEAKELEAENERLAKIAEQEAKDAAAKAALLAPDVDKLRMIYLHLKNYQFPEMATMEGKVVVNDISNEFDRLMSSIEYQAKKLK